MFNEKKVNELLSSHPAINILASNDSLIPLLPDIPIEETINRKAKFISSTLLDLPKNEVVGKLHKIPVMEVVTAYKTDLLNITAAVVLKNTTYATRKFIYYAKLNH